MTRRAGIASVLATVAGIALATISSPASAAVTIGSNLGATSFGASGNCGGGSTFTEQDLPTIVTALGGLRAPSDGVVVRWRIQIGDKTTPVALRIVRQPKVLISAMTGAGTGPTVPAPPVNQISTFEVRLPILTGERVGVDGGNGRLLAAFTPLSTAHAAQWLPPLVDGEPARSPFTVPDTDLLVKRTSNPMPTTTASAMRPRTSARRMRARRLRAPSRLSRLARQSHPPGRRSARTTRSNARRNPPRRRSARRRRKPDRLRGV